MVVRRGVETFLSLTRKKGFVTLVSSPLVSASKLLPPLLVLGLLWTGSAAHAEGVATVTTSAPIFVLPDSTRSPLRTVAANTVVRVLEKQDSWVKVEFSDPQFGARVGYIEARHLRIARPATQPSHKGDSGKAPQPAAPAATPLNSSAAPASTNSLEPHAPAGPRLATAQAPVPHPAMALLNKGTVVTVKVPLRVLKVDGYFFRGGSPIFAGNVASTGYGVTVEGQSEWKMAGFPSMFEMKVEKITRKKDYTELELRNLAAVIKFRFVPSVQDIAGTFQHLVVPGSPTSSEARAYLKQAYSELSTKVFTGPLAQLPEEKKHALLALAHDTASARDIRTEIYKNQPYVVFDLGEDTAVYNDLKFNQSSMVAYVLNEKLFTMIKGLANPLAGTPEAFGVKLEFHIPHKSFLEKDTVPPSRYELQVYAPTEQIKKFKDADITNQQFIDAAS